MDQSSIPGGVSTGWSLLQVDISLYWNKAISLCYSGLIFPLHHSVVTFLPRQQNYIRRESSSNLCLPIMMSISLVATCLLLFIPLVLVCNSLLTVSRILKCFQFIPFFNQKNNVLCKFNMIILSLYFYTTLYTFL